MSFAHSMAVRRSPSIFRTTLLRVADLFIYHLRMIRPDDRSSRLKRYEALDPGARFQFGLGDAHLTDKHGFRLRPVPAARGSEE